MLPFRISGEVDPLLFTRSELPALLQQATHFLVRTGLQYPVLDLQASNSAAERQKYGPSSPFTPEKASALCIDTGSNYLLAGSANWTKQDQVVINIISFQCRGGQVLARGRHSGSLSRLQSLLRDALFDSTPFARRRTVVEQAIKKKAVDLAVVLDTSGSMAPVLPHIHSLLRNLSRSMPVGSRMAAFVLENRQGEKVDSLSYTANVMRMTELLESRQPAAEISEKTLEAALSRALTLRAEPRGGSDSVRKLLVFSDVPLGQNQAPGLEDRLRQLRHSGMQIALYQLASQGPTERQEWARLSRSLALENPEILWGRRSGFLQGYSVFFIHRGNRFFRANTDLKSALEQDQVDMESLIPLEMATYTREELNLLALPEAYARRNNLKLTGNGPLVTNLEKKAHMFVMRGTADMRAPYKVLLQQEGNAFWVQIADPRLYRQMSEKTGEKVFVGVHLTRNAAGELVNLPDSVYLYREQDVPRLFVNNWSHIMKVSGDYIQPADIWFFQATIKEFSGGQDLLE
ncbi:MAG: VWA domain-containing protein [Spirochaetales bacterium]|nr:VWA domain-containing protein [Spirochaetales bacterium]